jgi:NTE family protein
VKPLSSKKVLSQKQFGFLSYTGIFVPVTFDNRVLVDGGVTNNIACDVAKSKGADIVIAVNISRDIREANINSLIDIVGQSAANHDA